MNKDLTCDNCYINFSEEDAEDYASIIDTGFCSFCAKANFKD